MKTRFSVAVWMGLLLVVTQVSVHGEIPKILLYDGFYGDGSFTGSVSMLLRIYTNSTGGAYLFEDSNTVDVVGGAFSTFIGDNTTYGSLTSALASGEAYLETVVNGVTNAGPRDQFFPIAYSLKTESMKDGGVTTAMIADGAITGSKIADSTITTEDLNLEDVDTRYVNTAGGAITGSLSVSSGVMIGGESVSVSNVQAWKMLEASARVLRGMVYTNDFSSDPFQEDWTSNGYVWWVTNAIKIKTGYNIAAENGVATYSNSTLYTYGQYTLLLTLTNDIAYGFSVLIYQNGSQKAVLSDVKWAGNYTLTWTSAWNKVVLQGGQGPSTTCYGYIRDFSVFTETNVLIRALDATSVHADSIVVGEMTALSPLTMEVSILKTTNVVPKNEDERLVIATQNRSANNVQARDASPVVLRPGDGNNTMYVSAGRGGDLIVRCGDGGHSSYNTEGSGGSFIVIPGTNGTDGTGTAGSSYFAHRVYIGDPSTNRISYLEYVSPSQIVVHADWVPTGSNVFLLGTAAKPWKEVHGVLFYGDGVGIGTNSPSASLHVNGTARFEQGVIYVKPLGDIGMGPYVSGP